MVNTGVLFCAEASHTLGDYHVLTYFKNVGDRRQKNSFNRLFTSIILQPHRQKNPFFPRFFFFSQNHLTKRGKVN